MSQESLDGCPVCAGVPDPGSGRCPECDRAPSPDRRSFDPGASPDVDDLSGEELEAILEAARSASSAEDPERSDARPIRLLVAGTSALVAGFSVLLVVGAFTPSAWAGLLVGPLAAVGAGWLVVSTRSLLAALQRGAIATGASLLALASIAVSPAVAWSTTGELAVLGAFSLLVGGMGAALVVLGMWIGGPVLSKG